MPLSQLLFLIISFIYNNKESSSFTLPSKLLLPIQKVSLTELQGTNRKARRLQKKNDKSQKSRPQQYYDLIDTQTQEAQDGKTEEGKIMTNLSNVPVASKASTADVDVEKDPTKANSKMSSVTQNEDVLHGASVTDAKTINNQQQPEVSQVVIDETTGIERIIQGKAVMDVITRKAVVLYDDPMIRLAQFSPGIPMDLRDKYRFKDFFSQNLKVPDIITLFQQVAYEDLEQKILPPHPNVRNEALDFVLANRDFLGQRFKKTLGRFKLRYQSLGELEKSREYRALWKHFYTIEDHLSAPFRQMIMNSESVIGPNFGNLDVNSYLDGDLPTRTAHYITLKATVAHWEKKLKDAESLESTNDENARDLKKQPLASQQLEQILNQQSESFMLKLCVGDPKRYLPDPPIIFQLEDVVKVCSMAQQIAAEFVKQEHLFQDLPTEVRFLEKALYIKGGTELRRYMIEEYCPMEQITPDALREGLRRLDVQLSNLQIDPYGDFKNVVGRLCDALSVGSDEEFDPYAEYLTNLDPNAPGYFQTYTFNHDKNSLVRFLDNAKTIEKGSIGPTENVVQQISGEVTGFFGGSSGKIAKRDPMRPELEPDDDYRPPEKRAIGRPHKMGWLDLLQEEKDIVKSGDKDKLEADLWKEITD